jgi:glutamate carboxypeptidase
MSMQTSLQRECGKETRVAGANELRLRLSGEDGRLRLVEDLAGLVAVESPSTDEVATAASADAVAALGTRLLGAAPERHGNHLEWRNGETKVLLIGHHDTVWPVGTLARWPFRVDGDKATGPGCFDMKAGLVQMFHALSVLPSLDGVTIVVNADEEIGSPSSRRLIEAAAQGARAALVCEPSADGALKTARKGIAQYRLEVAGRAAHAGLDPGLGVNAGVELAHQILAVADIGQADTTVTPTMLMGGTSENTVPAFAALAVDVRSFQDADFDRVDRAIRRLRPVLDGTQLTVRRGLNRPALPRSASTHLYQLACAVAVDLGLPALSETTAGGASDGNFTAAVGVPTLDGLGPVGGNAHAEGEWVDISAMADRAALLAGLVERLLGHE